MTNHRGEAMVITRDATGARVRTDVMAAGGIVAQTNQVQRDALGRVSAEVDSHNNRTRMMYGADGRLNGVQDPVNNTRSVHLDLHDHHLAVTQPNTAAMRQPYAASFSDTLSLVRDPLGRVTRMTYPSGTIVDFAYSGDVVSSISVNGSILLNSITYRIASDTELL